MTVVLIEPRFNGPPDSGNGGYSAGLVAAALPPGNGIPEVTLRSPPPLGRELRVESRGDGIAVLDGDTLVAEAARVAGGLNSPAAVDFETAATASGHYLGFHEHPYPSCFVCGPERTEGDGLRIFPGAVPERGIVAAPWVPDHSVADEAGVVREETMWAALDCPSWFGFGAFESWEGRPLLGRLAAELIALPRAGDRLVSVAWPSSRDGRKVHVGAAVYTEDGSLLARSRATWLIVP